MAGVHEAKPKPNPNADVHEDVSHAEVKRWMERLDPDGSGYIETSEFVDAMLLYITTKTIEAMEAEAAEAEAMAAAEAEQGDVDTYLDPRRPGSMQWLMEEAEEAEADYAAYVPPAELTTLPRRTSLPLTGGAAEGAEAAAAAGAEAGADGLTHAFVATDEGRGGSEGGEEGEEGEEGDEDEEEDAEVPEELLGLSWQEQQRHIKRRAARLMGVGTLGILLFADPMVEVLANVGSRVRLHLARIRVRAAGCASSYAPPMRLHPPGRLACNPTCSRLQPYALHAATLCLQAANLCSPRCNSYAHPRYRCLPST